MMSYVLFENVEQLRNIGIINFTTRSHLVGYFYMIYGEHGFVVIPVSVSECFMQLNYGHLQVHCHPSQYFSFRSQLLMEHNSFKKWKF